jgi:hypothetical protein
MGWHSWFEGWLGSLRRRRHHVLRSNGDETTLLPVLLGWDNTISGGRRVIRMIVVLLRSWGVWARANIGTGQSALWSVLQLGQRGTFQLNGRIICRQLDQRVVWQFGQ